MKELKVKDVKIKYVNVDGVDYLSLTDLSKFSSNKPDRIIERWIRTRNTIEYLAVWESLYNPNFNESNLNQMRIDSGGSTFMLSVSKWVSETNAVGIFSQIGRSGGTYAHKDIAFKFASWLSVEFELYLIREFQRLKTMENDGLSWNIRRELSRINYHIHTSAIKENLIAPNLTLRQTNFIYSDEADLLNVALFGKTASEWKKESDDNSGNIRDSASIHQLLVLANLESVNAAMISDKIPQNIRIVKLNEIARNQLEILMKINSPLMLK